VVDVAIQFNLAVSLEISLSPATLAALGGKAQLDRIESAIAVIAQKEILMQATIDDILAEATAQKTLADSAVALLQKLFAMRNDPAKLQSTMDTLLANKQEIADALVANTPAENPAP